MYNYVISYHTICCYPSVASPHCLPRRNSWKLVGRNSFISTYYSTKLEGHPYSKVTKPLLEFTKLEGHPYYSIAIIRLLSGIEHLVIT